MGLDQNWLIDDSENPGKYKEIHYHRKFNALEGFMQDKWYEAGNSQEFNCRKLPITEDILTDLEKVLKQKTLEPTAGYFFGEAGKDKSYYQDIKELEDKVIPLVKGHMQDGRIVYYTSWW